MALIRAIEEERPWIVADLQKRIRALGSGESPSIRSFRQQAAPTVREWAREHSISENWILDWFFRFAAFELGADPDDHPRDSIRWRQEPYPHGAALRDLLWSEGAQSDGVFVPYTAVDHLEIREVAADPFTESRDDFLKRAKRHWDCRAQRLRELGLRQVPELRSLRQHVRWWVRYEFPLARRRDMSPWTPLPLP